MANDLILFSGTAAAALAGRIAQALGQPLGRCTVERFPDGSPKVAARKVIPISKGLTVAAEPAKPGCQDVPDARGSDEGNRFRRRGEFKLLASGV